ncbi:MAG: 23S rRNA (uracil(1939)-C(5))-methyltransferase RlmD [Lactovum sp.]
MMKKNDIFEGEVIDLTHEALGVVRYDNFPFFVENALPTETVKLRVLKIGKKVGFARVEEYLTKSENRVENLNLDYLRTGIADLAHLSYEEQLKFKQNQVRIVLSKVGIETEILETFPSEKNSAYRNKAQIPVREKKGQLETGFFRKNSHELVPIEDFFIQEKRIDELVLVLRNLFRLERQRAYDEVTGQGDIRNLVIRRAHASAELMLIIVVSRKIKINIQSIIEKFPEIKSIQLSIKKDKGNAILGKEMQLIYGQDYIEDELLGKKFRISAESFYQVNSPQAEKLYQIAYDFAELTKDDIVVDAYSGIGTIGICMADKVKAVYGMEIVEQAVKNAKVNTTLNGLSNVYYEQGKAEEVFDNWLDKRIHPDVIFVDPPRKGLTESFIQSTLKASPSRIIYISCNPASLARDLALYEKSGYKIEKIQPVDLFPQTHHVECVVLMSRVDK